MERSLLLATVLLVGLTGTVRAEQAETEASLVSRGEHLARIGDCVACHTAPGGKPFAGGLAIESDLGQIFSTNITPDKQSGIGSYSEAQFAAALRDGKRADGANLYPAMPYPSYRLVSDADVHALYTYFMKGVAAVPDRPPQTALGFPFNLRWGLSLWNLAFTPSGSFKPDPKASDEVNRGAYLVEGLGHCGSCHTPRAVTMQEVALDAGDERYLAGTELNGWHAPQLRAGGTASRGLAAWSVAEIVDYLGSGRNNHAAVGGEMKSVVENSTAYMTDAELHAIAAYLKSIPNTMPAAEDKQGAAARTEAKLTAAVNLAAGERLYLDNCGACHFVTGHGAPRVFPSLDGASVVNAQNPTGLITTILMGAETPSTDRSPSILPMPGFAGRLSDQEVAALASFIRSGWSNSAPAVTAEQVAKLRAARVEEHERSVSGFSNVTNNVTPTAR
jgi:mono/diheme cytochrome c family protein